jgi:hypothetical protein
MLGSSSAPCDATKLHRSSAIRACAHAVPTAPSCSPLKNSKYSVPRPASIPPANVINPTLMLFVIIHVEACGPALSRFFVHISCFSIDATSVGPSTIRANAGRLKLSRAPSAAPARKIITDTAT